jgi:hypothetical protein
MNGRDTWRGYIDLRKFNGRDVVGRNGFLREILIADSFTVRLMGERKNALSLQ